VETRNAVSTPNQAWDGDWDSYAVDASAPRPQVDPHAELRPIAVDESLTNLLFAARTPVPAAPPTAIVAEPVADPIRADAQYALFETV
jgi:hypothetical protein